LVTSIHTQTLSPELAPPETPTRRFHVSRAAGNVVLFERKASEQEKTIPKDGTGTAQQPDESTSHPKEPTTLPQPPSTPRKRPGAGTALAVSQKPRAAANGISEETLRQFEKFSAEVENDAVSPRKPPLRSPTSPPSRFTPKAPKLRFKDRHPAEAARLEAQDPEAMDIDNDDPDNPYVYDTYVREIVKPDANGHLPLPSPQTTSIGYIVLTPDDEEWWYESDSSDREFDTDDEDENAEDYYANDYPEDELSEDDEFDRDPYSHYRDENDETYDLDEESDVEEEEFSTAVPKMKGAYWGKAGEQ
jgi:hypothetical protein